MYKLSDSNKNAAIAQPVERILGKDEVASSNLASSSKPLKLFEFQGLFLFLPKSHELILHIKILSRDEVIIMKKIEMSTRESKNFLEVFEMFVISQAAKGVADITIRNYRPQTSPAAHKSPSCSYRTGQFSVHSVLLHRRTPQLPQTSYPLHPSQCPLGA